MSCKYCKHAEAHGFPPEGTPSWYCFTVYMVCSKSRCTVSPNDTCDRYEHGEPRIVRDDADNFHEILI